MKTILYCVAFLSATLATFVLSQPIQLWEPDVQFYSPGMWRNGDAPAA